MDFKWTSYEEFVKQHGKDEAFSCLRAGWKQKQYHKTQNLRNQVAVEIAKKDPRFKQAIKEELEKKAKAS